MSGWGPPEPSQEAQAVPTLLSQPPKRTLSSVRCCTSWLPSLFLEKEPGTGRVGMAAAALLCSYVQKLISCYHNSPHCLMVTFLTRWELGGHKGGFGHQKYSKHLLS